MTTISLLQTSDLLSGTFGVMLNQMLPKKGKALNTFGKHMGVSIVTRMATFDYLNPVSNPLNQQYVFAGIAGAVLESGDTRNMILQGGMYSISNYLGDTAAIYLDMEKELFNIKANTTNKRNSEQEAPDP